MSNLEYKVFYSWQKSTLEKSNRFFIRKALDKTVKQIRRDISIDAKPELDHDMKGLTGSHDIIDTILEKIENCDFYVCDVSIIQPGTRLSNSNVMYELGYASKALERNQILLIANLANGLYEQLPFNINHLNIMTYKLPPDYTEEVYNKELDMLIGKLKGELTEFFSTYSPAQNLTKQARRDLNSTNPDNRKNAINTLASLSNPSAIDELHKALSHEILDVRVLSATKLHPLNDSRIMPLLIEGLNLQEGYLYKEAYQALLRWGPLSVTHLLEILKSEKLELQATAIALLGAIGNQEAAEGLITFLPKASADLELLVVAMLSKIGTPESLEAIKGNEYGFQ